MPIYFFAAINRKDLDLYARYEEVGFQSIEKYGIECLAVSDSPRAIEGDVPAQRIILLRFENQAALQEWYLSPEYQQAIPLRHGSADTSFIFSFEGLSEK
ncbi:MAG: hypothetical protein JWQ90_3590 [Hydrocarboniphaga sp.]|uniref:DUF1330 domain-containing protein n=1 Tax=Hydrocarboniphaga sp. TaxID=2033016 RepID=UPI002609D29B|nr:DUF1330 domain-containing protein [Hydrocarboniphaga sp.]MDB5971140.1 hypothetical protein [Hydrocarboniphaga sp.]